MVSDGGLQFVAVKNLRTGATAKLPASNGEFHVTFNLSNPRGVRVGDLLEITAQTTSPATGVQPVHYIVSVDDLRVGQILLPELIIYEVPQQTLLLNNYPNPFNPETWIPYRLAEAADVTLTIYDATGSVVRRIHVGHRTPAAYTSKGKAIYWDGRNDFGERVSSGVYFYQLKASDYQATKKMVIVK